MIEQPKQVVALLPMKAHSERVKGKNFRDFNGKPLFRWVLDRLLSMPEISRVVINTDARETLLEKGLQESNKIIVRDRRADLCGDYVSMNEIIADDLAHVLSDIYMMTHATNPLLSVKTMRQALQLFFKEKEAGSLFTVNRFQSRFYQYDGTPINHDPDRLIRTQDLEPWYEENSNFYIFSAESFSEKKSRIGSKSVMFETTRFESIDIDDQDDWVLAELIAKSGLIEDF